MIFDLKKKLIFNFLIFQQILDFNWFFDKAVNGRI